MKLIELVEQFHLGLHQVVVVLLIWSNGVRVREVGNPVTAIKVLMLCVFNPDQLLRLLKQLVSST